MPDQTVAVGPVVDWLAFTIKSDWLDVTVGDLQKRFYGSTPSAKGGNYYSHSCFILGTGRIYWSPQRVEMGVHVVLPSSALTALASLEHFTPHQFIAEFLAYGAVFTRIDVAMDSQDVHMDAVIQSWEIGQVISRSTLKHQQIIRNGEGAQSLYVGSRHSERMVRFYDKALEQGLQDGSIWTRCEVEFKSDSAQLCAGYIACNKCLREIILSTVDFRIEDDCNKTRRTRCDWWESWIKVSESNISFAIAKVDATIAKTYAWLQRAVAPSMAFISFALGNTFWLNSMAEAATGRISSYKLAVLQAYEGESFAFT